MHAERNKALVRRYFEEFHNRRDDAVLDQLVTPDLVEPTRAAAARVRAAFPDYAVLLVQLIAEDNLVAATWVGTGTHQGTWDSPIGPVAPTGKPIAMCGATTFLLADGCIVDVVGSTWDHLGLLQQLDVVPTASERPGG